MRRIVPPVPRQSYVRLLFGISVATALAFTSLHAQKPYPGRNVNVMSGLSLPDGDPYLQRQNEPSIAASTRNPMHLLGGSNDYRTVDIPGLNCAKVDPVTNECLDAETRDAWVGLFKSVDGGQRWKSTLHPGFQQDDSPAGLASPLKAYQAGADAVVRAGTHGMIYYSGLVFDRDDNGKSAIFLSRFIDNNNQEAGDPFAFLGTTLVAKSASGSTFLDKPWLAVDMPRANATMCSISTSNTLPLTTKKGKGTAAKGGKKGSPSNPQQLPGGAVYVSYTAFTGEGATRGAQVWISRSMDCGKTWGEPIRVSRPEDQLNQGSNIAIDPRNGNVYVAYRRFDPNYSDANDLDAMMVARVPFNSKKADTAALVKKFPKAKASGKLDPLRITEHRGEEARERAEKQNSPGVKDAKPSEAAGQLEQFDLDDRDTYSFRSLAYPTMAIDGEGRVYIAWTQRGFASDPVVVGGTLNSSVGARIVMTTTRDGKTFAPLQVVDDHSAPGKGHQLMPSMTFAGGKLMLIFYDMRETRARSSLSGAGVHTSKASDIDKSIRHTIDIRSVMAAPGDLPKFSKSEKVSDYLVGFNPNTNTFEQLQVNPPNLPMFKKGTAPFMGDYIDVAAAPAFIPLPNGKWSYNVNDTGVTPVFHAVWTDNRDVRPPTAKKQVNGVWVPDWTKYTPARITDNDPVRTSLLDGSTVPQCTDNGNNSGTRNQNVYTSRITTDGLIAGSPGNAKPLSTTLQRGFVVFATNTTDDMKSYRMTILSQPPGGRASFNQFPLPPFTAASPAPETAIEMLVPARSTATRTVYITSSDPDARVNVDVSELEDLRNLPIESYPSAREATAGAGTLVYINPDVENPDVENPDVENPDVENPDVENAEVYNPDVENPDVENPDVENPDVENPDVENPDVENPDVENPDVENPDVENVRVANPGIENPDVENPDVENPDVENPDVENPDVENPDVENSAISDITWKVTNTGNTTASFNVNLFLAQQELPLGVKTQLILLKTYRTPVTAANKCDLGFQVRNIILANIPDPQLVLANGEVVDPNDPRPTNATLWLSPGEEGRIVLRLVDETPLEGRVNIPKLDENGNPVLDANGIPKVVSVPQGLSPSENVTSVVQQQSVNTEEAEQGVIEPPVVPSFPAPQAVTDSASTAELTPVTINVLANDSTAFGSTKVISLHPAGMAAHSGGFSGDITYQPATGYLYTQRGIVDPATNALVGRLGTPSPTLNVAYQQANPRTGINYQRTFLPNAVLTALDARPDSTTFHRYLTMPALADSVLSFGMDTVHHRLYVLHGENVQTPTSRTWFSAIDIDPAHVIPSTDTPRHDLLYTIALPAGLRGNAVAVNTRTQKVYLGIGGSSGGQGGVFVVDGTLASPTATRVPNTFGNYGIAVNESSNQIFAATATGVNPNFTFQLNVVDGATLAVTTVSTSLPMRFSNHDERLVVHEATSRAFMRLGSAVVVIDGKRGSPTRNTVVATIPVGADQNNADIAIDQQLGRVITTGQFDYSAHIIDAATHSLVRTVALPIGGTDVAVDPVQHVAFVSTLVTSIIKVPLVGNGAPLTIPVFIESGGPIVNPVTNRTYVTATSGASGIGVVSGAGPLASISGITSNGRYLASARQVSTNRFFITNTGNQAGTSSGPGTVVVVDGATDAVIKQLPTLPIPFGIGIDEPAAKVYVASVVGDGTHGGVRIFNAADLDAPGVDATFTTTLTGQSGAFPLNNAQAFVGFSRFVVPNPITHKVYLTTGGGSPTSVAVLDPDTNVITPLDGAAGTPLFDYQQSQGQTWGRANLIRAYPALNRIIIGFTNGTTNRGVVIDGATHQVLYNVIVGGQSGRHPASYVVLDEAMQRLFVSDYAAGKVHMLDAVTMATLATVDVPAGPDALAVNLATHRLYVSSIDTKMLSALDYTAATLEMSSSVHLPLVAYYLTVDEVESRIYTSGGDSADESGVMVVTDILGQLGTNVSVTGVSGASKGTVVLNADYSVTYTPHHGQFGADSFTYSIAAPTGTATGTVNINIAPSNPTSVSFGDAYATSYNQPLSVSAPGPLANDASGDGVATMVIDQPTSNGQLSPASDGSFVYTPNANFSGTDSFTYHTLSPLGASNPSTVTITVSEPNELLVTTVADTGGGSLRTALTIASSEPHSIIRFNIPGAGPHVILAATPLPVVTAPVVIDGYTQPGASENTLPIGTNANLRIEIRGAGQTGLDLRGGNSTVRGLVINGFNTAIRLDVNGNNRVEGNFIGTNRDGSAAAPGSGTGISSRSPNNFIGGSDLAARNLISGHNSSAIRVEQSSTGSGVATVITSNGAGTTIVNNLIGTNAAGNAAVPNNGNAITVTAPNVTIGGQTVAERNVIAGNTGVGVQSNAATAPVSGAASFAYNFPTNLVVQGNYIGVRADGSAALPNTSTGVQVNGANSLIGGTGGTTPGACTGACNVISGNGAGGVNVSNQYENPQSTPNGFMGTIYSQATGTQVIGNFIGVDPSGAAAMPNTGNGVSVQAPNVTVGSSAAGGRNVIAANTSAGISFGISTVSLTNTVIATAAGSSARANYVGLNAAGTGMLANTQSGIITSAPGVTIGGPAAGDGNRIVATSNSGAISTSRQFTGVTTLSVGTNTIIQGNIVGVFADGTRSSMRGTGISINSSSNQVLGNIVAGLGTGAAPFANSINVSGNNGAPADDNVFKGNIIGTDASGAPGLRNNGSAGISLFVSSRNTIGGATAAERNIVVGTEMALFVSANTGQASNNNVIKGNHFGVRADGLTTLANDGATSLANNGGIQLSTTGGGTIDGTIIGGAAAGERNVIASAVLGNGVTLFGSGTINSIIRGNFIGVGVDGTTARGNNQAGVFISDGSGNSVGGPAPADGNVIAFNNSTGVVINGANAVRNSILHNRIFSNTGLGIDLSQNGVTNNDTNNPIDGDSGPNNLQNFPVLSGASNSNGANTTINVDPGSFGPGNFTIQFFASSSCAPRQAQRFVGSTMASNSGVTNVALNEPVGATEFINATATDDLGNTSEFSACVQVQPPTVVTSVSDSGTGSLRAAIDYANLTNGAQIITFNIPGTPTTGSPAIINLTGPLPAISETVTIDATTQPGWNVTSSPVVVVNGLGAGSASGLVVNGSASASVIKGLSIVNFSQNGIALTGNNHLVQGNYVGLMPNGTTVGSNTMDGISINGGSNLIGGTVGAQRNVVSGNGRDGVRVSNSGGTGNAVVGNYIGVTASGSLARGNGRNGVTLEQSNSVTVGGSAGGAMNIISGNGQHGVHVFVCDPGLTCNGHLIEGNRIGTNANGTVPVANAQHGVYVQTAPNNIIKNNLLSGNTLDGVSVYSNSLADHANNVIIGNLVGTSASGNTPLSNQRHGVSFVGPTGSRIGGTQPSERNVIAYNGNVGVSLENTTDATVQGNFIGVNQNGDAAGNQQQGVLIYSNVSNALIGGTAPNAGNVISSNLNGGIYIGNGSHDNTIRYNTIGWDLGGTNGRGNTGNGIGIDGNNNVVQDNQIANSTLAGIRVSTGTGNTLSRNRVTNNAGLGIDLGPLGQSSNDLNDTDGGANNLQNYPVLTSVSSNGSDTTVVGTFNSAPNSSFTLEFFETQTADPSGFGEGARYLAQLPATTDGSGNFSFSAPMTNVVTTPGWFVTATATDAAGNTSEFSAWRQVDTDLVVVNGADSGAGSLRAAMTSANATPGAQTIRFAFPGPAGLITITSQLPPITESVIIDGATQPGYVSEPLIEVTSATPGALSAFGIQASNVTIRGLSITRFWDGIVGVEGHGGHLIEHNIIGTNRGNNVGLGNAQGIDWRANTSTIRNNVIAGNTSDGMTVTSGATGNQITNNKIGVGTDGVVQLPNGANGVRMSQGAVGNTFTGNVIAANTGWGVNIQNVGAASSGNLFFSNRIGVDGNGNDAGNFAGGMRLENAPSTVVGQPGQGNTISGNGGNNPPEIGVGILVLATTGQVPTIRSNYIGLDPTGVDARSNNNTGIVLEGPAEVGGPNVQDRNFISGNGDIAGGTGIMVGLGGGGSNIRGNVIGLNKDGQPVGNGYSGITVRSTAAINIGGAGAGEGNVLSGNGAYGISVMRLSNGDPLPNGTVIKGNTIGLDVTGTVPSGNGQAGINAQGTNLVIGGAGATDGNIIANNGVQGGIRVGGIPGYPDVTGVTIRRNSIYQNGGLGIDLGGNGVTANDSGDADTGPNNLLNYVTLSAAQIVGNTTTIGGLLQSLPNTQFTIEFFESQNADPTGYGPGQRYLASLVASTNGLGNLVFNNNFPVAATPGWFMTATVTDPLGNTSEFALAKATGAELFVTNTNDSGAGSLRDAIDQANVTNSYDTIKFAIPGADGLSPAIISPQSPLPIITNNVIINGESQTGWDGKPVVEINGGGSVTRGFETATDVSNVMIRGLAITRFSNAGVYFAQSENAGGHALISNFIGTDRFNSAVKGNVTGVLMRTDSSALIANVIAGNSGAAVVVENDADNIEIRDNTIGLAYDKLTTLSNAAGIVMYGTENNALIDNNIISGNIGWGIDLQASAGQVFGTQIRRNTIGLDKDGNDAGNGINNPPGGGGGIRINGGPATVIGGQPSYRNVISGNGGPNPNQIGLGILIEGTASIPPVIKSNYIGLDPTGVFARGNWNKGIALNSPATIGGTGANDRNYISGNGDVGGGAGILADVNAGGTIIYGNVIGLNVNSDPVPNGYSGITVFSTQSVLIGSGVSGQGNVIAGNGVYGISVIKAGANPYPSGAMIRGNYIGTNEAEQLPLGNGSAGIFAGGNNLVIGGVNGGERNAIANNGSQGGIRVDATVTGVRMEGNAIYNNGGIGIDLNGDGATANDANDADTGANNLQNHPVLSNAVANGQTTVTFDTTSFAPAPSYVLNFYVTPSSCTISGPHARTWVGSTVAANNVVATFTLNLAVPAGYRVTATATDAAGNTSEFADCVQIAASTVVTNADPSGPGSLRAAIEAANAAPGAQTITFNIPGVGPGSPAIIGNAIQLPMITDAVTIDARTQPGYDNRPVIEIAGNNQVPIGFETAPDVSGVTIRGFAITGFSSAGIVLMQAEGGASNLIRENYIGTDRDGNPGRANGNGILLRADNSYVDVNVIAGNNGSGVVVEGDADGIRISGNTIGVMANGVTALGNNGSGIVMYDSPDNALIDANIIANNAGWGIDLQDTAQGDVFGTIIRNNAIGLYGNNPPAGNAQGGIKINKAASTLIGGGGQPNTIAYNGGAGIAIIGNPTAGVRIDNNPIHHNTGLGIDLDNNGVTANDPGDGDSGPNTLLNYPEFSGVTNNSYNGNTFVTLDTNSLPAGYNNVNFFKSQFCDASGFGEGEQVVMRFGITGQAGSIELDLNQVVPPGWFVTATVIHDATGNTSEFSSCSQVVAGYTVSGTVQYSSTPLENVNMDLLSNLNDPPIQSTGSGPGGQYAFNNVPNGTYWIKSYGPDASYIGWSAVQVVVNNANSTKNIALAKKLTLVSPSQGATGVAAQPMLTWNGLPEATKYVIQINHNNTWQQVDPGAESATNSYQVQTQLTAGQMYTWQVDAYDSGNRHVGTTEIAFQFTVATATPNIASVHPGSTFGSGQMITINGSNFNIAGPQDVIINIGQTYYPASSIFYNSPTKIIARTDPFMALGPGNLTIRTQNGSPLSTAFNVNVQATPVAPLFITVRNGNCSGYGGPGDTPTTWSGNQLLLVASGIDTTGTRVFFTPSGGGVSTEATVLQSCAWAEGDAAVHVQVPAIPVGTYDITIRTTVGGNLSAASNAKTLNVEPFVINGVAGGGANNNCLSCIPPAPGQFGPQLFGQILAGQTLNISASGQVNNGGTLFGPAGSGACSECLDPALPRTALIGRWSSGNWFLIGTGGLFTNPGGADYLQLAVNDRDYTDNGGQFSVIISPQ